MATSTSTTPSSATSTMTAPQAQQDQGPQPSQPKPKMPVRRKKETTLFQKKPSRPFALAAMQAANGTAPKPSSSVLGTMPRINRAQASSSTSISLAVPVSKPQQALSQSHSRSPSASSPSPAPSTSQNDTNTAAASSTTPELPYQEYQLMSCDRHGWQYDVFKFDSRKPVDILTWARPVKLNRKEIKRADNGAGANTVGETAPVPVGPMLGPDGKPVIGADGRIVMVDADGKPIHSDGKSSGPAPPKAAAAGSKDDKTNNNKKKKFQKKTRQVFLVPEHIRQLRKEERYPWVMEDGTGKEVWEGRMEEAAKSELHGLFMPAPDQVFKFVPAHRWYKFQKRRPQHLSWSLEEAEKMMAKMQKSKDTERWLRRDDGKKRIVPTAGGIGSGSLVHDEGRESRAFGGRRLHTVDTGSRGLFGDDDDDDDDGGGAARRARAMARAAEGDLDEMEYEEDFADDDERVEADPNDEEARELEERLKREYKNANKTREGHIDESDDDDDLDNLTGAGKEMKKLVRKVEKNAVYDSDDEKNPYASSEEEEEEEEAPTPTATGVQEQPQTRSASKAGSRPASSRASSRSGSPAPPSSAGSNSGVKIKNEGGGTTSAAPPNPSQSASLLSPPPQSPALGMGGHSVVAKRATSPKAPSMPKLKTNSSSGNISGSRATSPLAGGTGSRAGSPNPLSPSGAPSRSGSPGITGSSKKRKAEDGASTGAGGNASPASANGVSVPKTKKRKPTAPNGSAASGNTNAPTNTTTTPATASTSTSERPVGTIPIIDSSTTLTAALLVQWLRASPGTTTRECIQYFQPCLTDEGKKGQFTTLVKEVATLRNGVLVLKGQYRDGAAASA